MENIDQHPIPSGCRLPSHQTLSSQSIASKKPTEPINVSLNSLNGVWNIQEYIQSKDFANQSMASVPVTSNKKLDQSNNDIDYQSLRLAYEQSQRQLKVMESENDQLRTLLEAAQSNQSQERPRRFQNSLFMATTTCSEGEGCPHISDVKLMKSKLQRLESLFEKLESKNKENCRATLPRLPLTAIEKSPIADMSFTDRESICNKVKYGKYSQNRTIGDRPAILGQNRLSNSSVTASPFSKIQRISTSTVMTANRNTFVPLDMSQLGRLPTQIQEYRRKRVVSTPNVAALLKVQNCYNALRK